MLIREYLIIFQLAVSGSWARFLAKYQHTSREIFVFSELQCLTLHQKVPKSDFQNGFLMKRIIRIAGISVARRSSRIYRLITKICDWAKYDKIIWVTRLLFCQNDSPMRGSFWKKDSLITYILFELQPITIFSPVANFGDQSL